MMSTCNPSTKEAEAGGLRLETILGYKQKNKKQKSKQTYEHQEQKINKKHSSNLSRYCVLM